MPDLLELSARIIDTGDTSEPNNRITQELSEVADDIAVVESFSHVVAVRTDDGLVTFDASGVFTGADVVAALRGWSTDPVHTLVYTHGHVDHVGGSGAVLADAAERGHARPTVVGHDNVPRRLARYRRTDGHNLVINARQFGWLASESFHIGAKGRFLPDDVAEPDVTYRDEHTMVVGGLAIELNHARGETDDHTWAWLPQRRTIMAGDFLIWNFPNAGNPQKVQRYPDEWATALRAMIALEPELLIPAHGLPIGGTDRIALVLDTTASVLESLVEQTLALMNEGASLDTAIHTVRIPKTTLALPYLRPLYDEPEFVVRNIWRLYGGWYDGNPARLKPPPDAAVAREVAHLAGGAEALAARAAEVAADGDVRLACQLAEWAAAAAPDDHAVREQRASLYAKRRDAETSVMAKGIFGTAAREAP